MKTLLATTAIVMASAIPAFAESHSMATESGPFLDSAKIESNADLRASRLIGMSVYTTEAEVEGEAMADAGTDWDRIGEISDVILSRSGDMEAVLLDIGGFLGIGERTVAVTLSELKLVSDSDDADDFFVVLNTDRASIENAPEFDTDVIGAWNGIERTGENAADMAEETTEKTADAVENAAEDAEGTVVTTGAELNEAGDQAVETAETAGQNIEQEAEEMAADTEHAMDGMTHSPEGYMAADTATLTAEMIDGARVYDGRDEWIGEISEVIVAEDGKISEVILDVGGFLGLGEKHVSMPFDKLNLQQEDGGDDLRVYVSATKEELESMEDRGM